MTADFVACSTSERGAGGLRQKAAEKCVAWTVRETAAMHTHTITGSGSWLGGSVGLYTLRYKQSSDPTMGLEETLEYAKTIIPDEVASSLFNLPLKLEIVLSNTDDLWFTAWPSRSKTSGLGATPAEAFKIATGIDLLDVMRLGHRIIKRSTAQRQIRFTRDELIADGATEAAIDYLFANMALPLDNFKVKLQADRDAGAIGHRRYTLTQFPFLAVDDNTFVMLRHQWALDRLCGGQLYFEAWFNLSTQSGMLGHRFKTAMNDAFENFAGGICTAWSTRARICELIVDEPDMQTAWKEQKGKKPSVCDWMLFGEDHCVMIDATNHAVKADAAQALATWDEYSADIEKIFTEGKFEQLLSTIGYVQKYGGWGDEKVDTKTMFAPLVVVPDVGVPPRATDTVRHRAPGLPGIQTPSAAGLRPWHRPYIRRSIARRDGRSRAEDSGISRQRRRHDEVDCGMALGGKQTR